MAQTVNFITSFPFAGADRLATIMSRDPSFCVTTKSDLLPITAKLIEGITHFASDRNTAFANRAAINACLGFWEGAYRQFEGRVCFDGCGDYGLRMYDILKHVNPAVTVILCVRDLRGIIESLEAQRLSEPFSAIKEWSEGNQNQFATIEQRTAAYIQSGALFAPLHSAYNLIQTGRMKELFIIRYEDLCRAPAATIALLYENLEAGEYKSNLEAKKILRLSPFSEETMNCSDIQSREPEPFSKQVQNLSREIIDGSRWYYEYFYPEELLINPKALKSAI